jgi:hypothetical protein
MLTKFLWRTLLVPTGCSTNESHPLDCQTYDSLHDELLAAEEKRRERMNKRPCDYNGVEYHVCGIVSVLYVFLGTDSLGC